MKAAAELELRRRLGNPAPRTTLSTSTKLARFRERYKNDYIGFTKLLVIDSRRGRIPFELSPIQLAYNAARTPRDVVVKARRIGMTTEAIARDLWHFLIYPNASVGIICQSDKDHKGVKAIRRILDPFIEILRERGLPLEFVKDTTTTLDLAMPGGNATLDIIEAGGSEKAASKTGRAGRYTRLHATEMAYWEFGGETVAAVRHCVAGPEFGTEIQIESTANGVAPEDNDSPKEASGGAMFFWEAQDARLGKNGYRLHFFPWYQDPNNVKAIADGEVIEPRTARERQLVSAGITPEQLKWYQGQLAEIKSQDLVDQELASDSETCFLLSGRTFFDKTKLLEALSKAVDAPITQHVRESGAYGQVIGGSEIPVIRAWQMPEAGKRYVLSADPSGGEGGDAAAAIVLERGRGIHVATIWGQLKPWEFGALCVQVAIKYNHALVAFERNNHGGTFLRALIDKNYQQVFQDYDEKYGWNTTEASRAPMLETFEKAFRAGYFETSDRFLLGEMRTFVVNIKSNGKSKAEAAKGAHDDLVMACGIGWDVICRAPAKTADLTGFVG